MSSRDIYVATTTFVARVDGARTRIVEGETFVRSGHKVLSLFPDRFTKIEPQYEVAANRSSGKRRKPKEDPEPEVLEPTPEASEEPEGAQEEPSTE